MSREDCNTRVSATCVWTYFWPQSRRNCSAKPFHCRHSCQTTTGRNSTDYFNSHQYPGGSIYRYRHRLLGDDRVTSSWQRLMWLVSTMFNFWTLMVSPPQTPVPLKYMYNANILGSDSATFVPSYTPMWHTIIRPKLFFLKNSSDNDMLPN